MINVRNIIKNSLKWWGVAERESALHRLKSLIMNYFLVAQDLTPHFAPHKTQGY